MLLAMTQLGAQLVGAAVTAATAGSASVNLSGTLCKLVNSSTVTLNSGTQWGSVSPFIGGHPGYADGTITFNAPVLSAAGVIECWSNTLTWTDSSSSVTENYAGLVITDPGSSSVYFAAPFDNPPIVFNSTLSRLEAVIRYNPAFPNQSLVTVVN